MISCSWLRTNKIIRPHSEEEKSGKRFVVSLHYNGINSFLFVNATRVYQFKAKDSEIKDYSRCVGIFSQLIIRPKKKQD